mmetsp:Transcript_33430/g.83448  ORF Transcript_33430/g.83448 Transcript_33430/m.83448 type:complete len:289 (-) Transcript_33430:133-999(-)
MLRVRLRQPREHIQQVLCRRVPVHADAVDVLGRASVREHGVGPAGQVAALVVEDHELDAAALQRGAQVGLDKVALLLRRELQVLPLARVARGLIAPRERPHLDALGRVLAHEAAEVARVRRVDRPARLVAQLGVERRVLRRHPRGRRPARPEEAHPVRCERRRRSYHRQLSRRLVHLDRVVAEVEVLAAAGAVDPLLVVVAVHRRGEVGRANGDSPDRVPQSRRREVRLEELVARRGRERAVCERRGIRERAAKARDRLVAKRRVDRESKGGRLQRRGPCAAERAGRP